MLPPFSLAVATPACSFCGYPEADPVEEVPEAVAALPAGEECGALALRLSANVGCFQTALCDGDARAARAFLVNVLAISQTLMKKVPHDP